MACSCRKDPPHNLPILTIPNLKAERKHGLDWSTLEPYFHRHDEYIHHIAQAAGFKWRPGYCVNPMPPEDAAKFLRETNL